MDTQCTVIICLSLTLCTIIVAIWLDRSYKHKLRLKEFEHEKQIAELRQQSMGANMQLSSVKDIVQSLAKSNEEIVSAWIGREAIEKELERVRSDRAQDADSKTK